MRPETLERALHLWPKWQESIEGARVQLEFQPDYDEEEWTKWDRKHGWHEVLGVCLHELDQTLNLPWYFAPYWMSCFFSNYKRVDGTYDFQAIRMPEEGYPYLSSISEASGVFLCEVGTNGKVYPPYPFIFHPPILVAMEEGEELDEQVLEHAFPLQAPWVTLTDSGELQFDRQPVFRIPFPSRPVAKKSISIAVQAGKGGITGDYRIRLIGRRLKGKEGIEAATRFSPGKAPVGTHVTLRNWPIGNVPVFRIEIPAPFMTWDVLASIFWHLLKYKRGMDKVAPHPLSSYINKAKVTPEEAKIKAVSIFEKTASVDEVLHELYFDPETQADSAFALDGLGKLYERPRQERRFRKNFRDRVIKWLRDAGLKPGRPKTKWWMERAE
jgi:hypothetical protein